MANGVVSGTITVASGGTLVNNGALLGNGTPTGVAALLQGNGVFVELPLATVVGRVVDQAGTDTLRLADGHASLYGLGNYFRGFGTVSVGNYGFWTLTGASTVAVGTNVVSPNALTVATSLVDAGTINCALTVASGASLTVSGKLGNGIMAATFAGAGNLFLTPGDAISGAVVGNAQATVNLMPGAANGYVSGIGSQFTNFGLIQMTHGGHWTFAGTNSLSGGLIVTSGGTLTATGATTIAGAISITGTGVFDARAGLSLAGGSIQSTAGTDRGRIGGRRHRRQHNGRCRQHAAGFWRDPRSGDRQRRAPRPIGRLVAERAYLGRRLREYRLGRHRQRHRSARRARNGLPRRRQRDLDPGTANAQLLPTVSGFANTDTIDLAGVVANTESLVGSTLKLLEGATKVASITLAGIVRCRVTSFFPPTAMAAHSLPPRACRRPTNPALIAQHGLH